MIRRNIFAIVYIAIVTAAAIVVVWCMVSVWGCKPPLPPPAPTPATTVAIVGGLGGSQMDPVNDAIRHAFPAYSVVNFGQRDGWLADIAGWLSANANGPIILCGHSKGAAACAKAATILLATGKPVKLLLLFDAVGMDGSNTIDIPAGVPCIHFKAGIPTAFIFRASIHGVYAEKVYPWVTHNSVPNEATPDAVAAIKSAL